VECTLCTLRTDNSNILRKHLVSEDRLHRMQSARSISEVLGIVNQSVADSERHTAQSARRTRFPQDKNWSVLETNVKYPQRENAYKRQMPVIALTRPRAKINYTDLPKPKC
jgi:hypothetical protein